VHGSSALIPSKDPKANGLYWKGVDAFFDMLGRLWSGKA
jgi:hypothetical protein